MPILSRFLLSGTAMVALATGASALAQTSASAPGADMSDSNEIIVTAQKRSERLQDVPLSVTALSGETLTDRNQTRFQDYFATVPGLNLTSSGAGSVNISMRGLTSGGFNNPVVGIVIDDVPYGPSTIAGSGANLVPDLDPADLSQVEILRGPQGTLYGASSIGGLIKYVTTDPSLDRISGRVEADVNTVSHGDVGYGLRGSINLPLSDRIALRVSGFSRRDAGYVDNLTTGKDDVNSADVWGGRAALLFKPTETLSIKLAAMYQQTKGKGLSQTNATFVALDDGSTVPLGRTVADDGLVQTKIPGSETYKTQASLFSATIAKDLGFADLTSITGYGIVSYDYNRDATDFYGSTADAFFGVGGSTLISYGKTRKFSQEVRLASSGSNRIDWLIGGFYTHEKTPAYQRLLAVDPATGAVAGTSPVSGTADGLIVKLDVPRTFKEYAAFGDLTVHVSDRFDVQFGGRYSHNSQVYNEVDSGLLVDLGAVAEPVITAKAKDHAFTYLISPSFKFSHDLMAYGRIATGYRVGGPNPGATLGFPSQYGSDTTTSYEVGLKGSLWDNLAVFDIAAFYTDWKDIALQVSDPETNFAYYLNGPKAKSQGIEASVQLSPREGLKIVANGAYTDAKLKDDLPAQGAAGLSGDRLPFSSKFSGSLSIDQEFAIGTAMTGYVGGTVAYVGKRLGSFPARLGEGTSELRLVLPNYTTVDLRAGVKKDGWSLGLFVSNLTDSRGLLGGTSLAPGGAVDGSAYGINYIRPRTVGASIVKAF